MKNIVMLINITLFLLSTVLISSASLNINPSVSVKEEYNDNIFLTRLDKEDDFITTIFPRIELQYSPNRTLDLNLDYGLRFRSFSNHSEFNDKTIREAQNAELSAQARFFKRVFIDISDTYDRVPVDIREAFAEDNLFLNMTERNVLSVSPYMKLPVTSTITSTIGYEYRNLWYREEDLIDADSHSAFVNLEKNFISNMSGALKYKYVVFRPTPSTYEYDSHEASAEIRYRITPNLQITGEVGLARYYFENQDDPEITFWNVFTDFKYGSTKLESRWNFSIDNSATTGAFKRNRIELDIKSGNVFILKVNTYYFVDKYLNTDREDEVSALSAEISRQLYERLTISLNSSVEKQKFLPEDEDVRKYSIGTSLEYRWNRSVTSEVGYRYNMRNSNIDTEDFHNNIVWLQTRVVF